MLFIGKFINNFKDFYNDINSATLTGAIDVVIVKQPDGSYVCSPFHVRFGKIGVLRSREKVVDIEVNGIPVDIHMKLGESGEAFFVEEVPKENEIPSYLATSPLPDVLNLEAEIAKMKQSISFDSDRNKGQTQLTIPVITPNNVAKSTETDLVLHVASSPSSNLKDCDISTSDNVSKKKPHVTDPNKSHQKASKTANDSNVTEDITNNANTDSSDECKTKRRRRKKMSTKKRTKAKEAQAPDKSRVPRKSDVVAKESDIQNDKVEDIFQMDEDYAEGEDEGFQSTGLSRSVSLPVSANIDDLFNREWSRRKMSSTFTGEFHPFSDGDVTPHSSPIASRPPSPKSDTEYENQKIDSGSPDVSGPSWGWGQLPNVPRNLSANHLQSLDASNIDGNKDADTSTDAEKRSMLGGMLNFMRSTKKIRHAPESEGIYLSELNADELDPELAALYFPKFKFYNWQTAASMLTSIIMYQRPLPEKAANQLINEHMPKKKKKSYSSWWSWRRSETERKPDMESLSLGESSSTAATTSSTETPEEKLLEEPSEQKLCDIELKEIVVVSIEETVKETVTEVVSKLHEQIELAPEEKEPLEEVVIEFDGSADEQTDVVNVPPSSECSTVSSSPINISHSLRPSDEPLSRSAPLPEPETVAHIQFSSEEVNDAELDDEDKPLKEKYMKSLRLTTKQINNLNLNEGPNEFTFSVTTAYQGTTKCTCQVFLWSYDDKIVISDIDGTITKSDVLGHILPMVGHSWAQLGVAKLFTKIQSNGYKFLYLSARAIGQARITREYLRTVRQGEICLPDGPLLLSPTSLISALHREVIERKPEEFKISCLKDIQTLFPPFMGNPFYAGFGNKINDQWAYRAVGIPLTRSFTINHRGELKLELIQTFQSSYTRLSDDVDHVFPPLKPRMKGNSHPTPIFSSPEEFSYFTYWREPVLQLSDDDISV